MTTDEWDESVRGTLEELLPARYGEVSTARAERNRAQQFTTQGQARPLLTCAEAQLADGWFAVATTELTGPTGDGGAAAYGTSLLFLNDGVFLELSAAELGRDGLEPNRPANLAAQELVDLASTPEFLVMVQVGVEWTREQPEPPHSVVDVPDPVWPTP